MTAATSSRGISPRPTAQFRGHANSPGTRIVGESAGADDRVIQAACHQILVGLGLRLEVRPHTPRRGVRPIRPDRADHHVTVHADRQGSVDELHGTTQVDGPLPSRTAARARAGGEHQHVGGLDVLGKARVGIQVAEYRHRAERLEVGGLPRLADQATGAVTLRGQQPQQAQGDLSVPTGHQDVHGWSLRVGLWAGVGWQRAGLGRWAPAWAASSGGAAQRAVADEELQIVGGVAMGGQGEDLVGAAKWAGTPSDGRSCRQAVRRPPDWAGSELRFRSGFPLPNAPEPSRPVAVSGGSWTDAARSATLTCSGRLRRSWPTGSGTGIYAGPVTSGGVP